MTEQYIAPGHRLSDEDWAAVVRRAREVREELAASAEGGASGPGGIVVDMTTRCVASKKYFPVSGIPTQLLVLHSAECPLRAGFAISLSEWFSATIYPAPPIASWQRFVDPVHRVRAIPDELGAWHASEANPLSIGWEQAGYARYTRAEWLTPDGRQQLELLAYDMAEVAVRDGIPAVWLTTAEVVAVTNGNRSIKGFCTHRQIDPDTRTDPGDGYPYDLLMERIRHYMGQPAEGPAEEPQLPEMEDDMLIIARAPEEGPKHWIGNGIIRRHIPDPKALADYQWLAREGFMNIYHDGEVQLLPSRVLGVEVREPNQLTIGMLKDGNELWIGDGIVRRHIPDEATLKGLRDFANAGLISLSGNGKVQVVPTLDVLGQAA